MKSFLLKSVMVVAGALLLTTAVQAAEMRFNVPFGFSVSDRKMPAGEYAVRWDSVFGLMTLENRATSNVIHLPPGIPAKSLKYTSTPSKMLFHQYGDLFFLHAIERSGDLRREYLPSKAEREISRGVRPVDVIVSGM